MTDITKKTVRELLTTRTLHGDSVLEMQGNGLSLGSKERTAAIDAAIARDDRLTRKLTEYQNWRDRWIESLPLRAATEFDNIDGDAP
jgi:hypothetical protein